MTVLQPIAPLIHKILREQVYNLNEEYRCPTFVFNVVISKGVLAYNLLTKEYIFYKNLQEEKEILVNKWFLVPNSFQEYIFVKNIKQLIKEVSHYDTGIRNYTIFTTTDCNARCFYCFEKSFSKVRMLNDVILSTVNFIKRNYHNDKLTIHWFGGEPLFNVISIEKISKILNESGVSFESHMTSNGFLFTKKLIQKAKYNWHLRKIQITLDGTKNRYNQIKSYINNEQNPFGKVLDNIRDILDSGICVTIRLNLSIENYSDLIKLVELLADNFSKYGTCKIYAMPLFEILEDYENRKNVFSKLLVLQKLIEEKNMDLGYSYFSKVRLNHCKADSNLESIIIFPDGNIGLCEHKWESQYIGNVWEKCSMNRQEIDKWNQYSMPFDNCSNCCLFPDCLKLKKCDTNNVCFQDLIEYDKHLIKRQMIKKFNEYETKISVNRIADQNIGIAIGKDAFKFKNLLFLNNTGKKILELLNEDISRDLIIHVMLETYAGDEKKS